MFLSGISSKYRLMRAVLIGLILSTSPKKSKNQDLEKTMPLCAAFGCDSGSPLYKGEKYRLHSFPKQLILNINPCKLGAGEAKVKPIWRDFTSVFSYTSENSSILCLGELKPNQLHGSFLDQPPDSSS